MRDDFSQKTIKILARRAGNLCSNPECRLPTEGASFEADGYVSVGIAAHITAAAQGGPRYDPSLTSEQRKSVANGIWLCAIHAKQIDVDPKYFTEDSQRCLCPGWLFIGNYAVFLSPSAPTQWVT
jgi:hypothetical protein